MAIILKDFNHVTVVQGELVPSSSSFDLEDLLGNFDYKRIIKMQFDRLDSNYQAFLTVSLFSKDTLSIIFNHTHALGCLLFGPILHHL